jgi:hypothetical protein
MTKSQLERAERAIVFAPHYREAALAYYQIEDPRPWRELRPIEVERWIQLAKVALMVNKHVIESSFGSPASASEPRRAPAAGPVEATSQFSPLKRYVSPLTQVK